MTHDVNSDPEFWELRTKFGDRAGFVWLEILSITDRNDGFLGKESDELYAVLASKCRVHSPKVRAIFGWCLGKGWLELRDGFRVVNHWKYHRTPEHKPLPSYPSEPSDPNLPKIKNPDPASPAPSADSSKKRKELDPEVKKWTAQIYAIDPKRYARLIGWVKAALRKHEPVIVAATLERFLPHARQDKLDWWPYLNKILDKQKGFINARNAESESARYKREEKKFIDKLLNESHMRR